MKLVNRSALIVRPKAPYLKWAENVDDDAARAAHGLESHVSVYLVREDPRGKEETGPLANYFGKIFALELEAWCSDENTWPERRDFKTFRQWFDVVGQSMVIDLDDREIKVEEL